MLAKDDPRNQMLTDGKEGGKRKGRNIGTGRNGRKGRTGGKGSKRGKGKKGTTVGIEEDYFPKGKFCRQDSIPA